MGQRILLNAVPIRLLSDDAVIYVSENDSADAIKCAKNKLTGDERHRSQVIYWSLVQSAGSTAHRITPADHRALFRSYLNAVLHDYLATLELPHRKSFLGGTEVWIPKTDRPTAPHTEAHKRFTLRILGTSDQHATPGWTLQVSYRGDSLLCEGHRVPKHLVKTFVTGQRIRRASTYDGPLPEPIKVVIDRDIARELQIPWVFRRDANKYLTFFNEVSAFYDRNLKGKKIDSAMQVLESGFGAVMESQMRQTTVDSNVLEFGRGRSHFNAYMGLKEYGPLAGPKVIDYKFFFIFHESNRDQANKLFQYFKRGFKGYPGLKNFVDVDMTLDKDKTIVFTDVSNPASQIVPALSNLNFDPDITYVAIYLTPIDRDEPDLDAHSDYYRVKQALLNQNIASQVIFRENIDKPNFNFSLPNISIALLAKLGGRPWRLSRPVEDELIFGIGAYRHNDQRLLGTTFTFTNDGTFLGFDAHRSDCVQDLGGFFERAIRRFVSTQESISRVVIHYFKKMSRAEENELRKALMRLDLQVPYIVVTISEESSREYVLFDDSYSGKMPRSGTCVMLKHGEYLLCNNTRYHERTSARIDDFPFPLRISISRTSAPSLDDSVTQKLIDQVYQFSRMYWRSVKQRAAPVTILYSQRIAELVASFPEQEIPDSDAAKNTLWFL